MKFQFVLLKFENDPNLADKAYWYTCDMQVEVGEKVLAPVGIHDRLQAAVVEEIRESEPTTAPYDIRTVKSVMSRLGVRNLSIDSTPLVEFGGARYDEKHYTPFGRILYTKEKPHFLEGFRFYGIKVFLPEEESDPFSVIEETNGGVLLYGERGALIFNALLSLLKGESDPLFENVDERVLSRLKEKLR